MILSGKYEGNYFHFNEQKIAVVCSDPKRLDANTFVRTMYKEDVLSLCVLNEQPAANNENIEILFGALAATATNKHKLLTIKIVWSDGEESIATIVDEWYTHLLATQAKPNPTKLSQPSINLNQPGKTYTFYENDISNGITLQCTVKLTDHSIIYKNSSSKDLSYDLERAKRANESGEIPFSSISAVQYEKNSQIQDFLIVIHGGKRFVVSGKQNLEVFAKDLESRIQKWKPSFKISAKSGGCYVATCVYGSYDCPEVWTLRRFRDNTLGATWYGRAFIRTYYAISPTIVKWFGNTAWFKKMWKGTLDRMVKNLEESGVENTPYQDKNW